MICVAVRFDGKGTFVDNTIKGGVAVSLDIEVGMFQSYGMRKYALTHYTEHLVSHLKFENTKVTQWSEGKVFIEKTLKCIHYYAGVGLDVAITNDGPAIIEINTGASIYLSQMSKEIGMRTFCV